MFWRKKSRKPKWSKKQVDKQMRKKREMEELINPEYAQEVSEHLMDTGLGRETDRPQNPNTKSSPMGSHRKRDDEIGGM